MIKIILKFANHLYPFDKETFFNNLTNQKIVIHPNDFIGNNVVHAYIVHINKEKDKLLLQLKNPLEYKNRIYNRVVIQQRHENGALSDLKNKGYYSCNAIWIPNEKFDENIPFDTSWWRGGAAAVTSISIV